MSPRLRLEPEPRPQRFGTVGLAATSLSVKARGMSRCIVHVLATLRGVPCTSHRCVATERLRLCSGTAVLGTFLVWGEEDAKCGRSSDPLIQFHFYSALFEFGGEARWPRDNLEGVKEPRAGREWVYKLSLKTSLDCKDVPNQSPRKLWELWHSFPKRRGSQGTCCGEGGSSTLKTA